VLIIIASAVVEKELVNAQDVQRISIGTATDVSLVLMIYFHLLAQLQKLIAKAVVTQDVPIVLDGMTQDAIHAKLVIIETVRNRSVNLVAKANLLFLVLVLFLNAMIVRTQIVLLASTTALENAQNAKKALT